MINWVVKLLKFSVAVCMTLMVAVVTWQVLSRYAMGDPSPWTEEVARMLLIWVGLLGGAYAYHEKAHLGLDLLYEKSSPGGKKRLDKITDICCGLFALAVLIIGGGALVSMTWTLHQTTAVLGISMAYVYAVLPISGALIVFFSLASLLGGRPQAAP